MLRLPRCALLCVTLLALSTAVGLAESPARTPLQAEDLYRIEAQPAVVAEPGAAFAVCVRRWIEPADRRERLSLWRVDGSDAQQRRPLEAGEPDARGPVFSPDGQWIAIRSTRPHPSGSPGIPPVPPESDPATDIWLLSSDGTRVLPLVGADKPYGRVYLDLYFGRIAFSPDGKRLLFVADDGKDARTQAEQDADVLVVRPDQGEGYTGYGPAQIWIADLDLVRDDHAATQIRRLTNDGVWYGDPQWSPDGQFVVCHADKSDAVEGIRNNINKNFDLWQIAVATGTQRQLTTTPGPDISPRISPDGSEVVYLHVPRRGPHADIYSVARLPLTGTPVPTIVYDHHAVPAGDAPHPAPTYPLPDDCWEQSGSLVYSAPQGLRTATMRLDLTTGVGMPYEPQEHDPSLSPLGRRTLAVRRATPPPGSELSDRLLGEERTFEWSNEGWALEGSITLPPAEVARAPYPVVVYPHGGPHSRTVLGFNFTAQFLAAQGYLVFQPNFRGSVGYDRAFLDANRADFGGGDMRDILSGITALTGAGLIDPQRQFVYGVSYGGFMTTWLVGHTRQFRAAVAQNAVTQLDVMWGVSDIQSWTEWEFEGRPWHVPDRMRAHSPLTYADQVATPTLILHSREDRRCPLPMGRMFYVALAARGVPTGMVIYPNEGHGIKQPRHQVDVLQRVAAWFRQHDR